MIKNENTYKLKNFGLSILDKQGEEKYLLKAKELAKIKLSKFSKRDISIEVLEEPVEINGLLKVSVSATKNGKEIIVNNPIYFKNPPIMVRVGTFHTETDFSGKQIQVEDVEENIEEAFKEIIVQALEIEK